MSESRLLTNAHAVLFHMVVCVTGRASDLKNLARLLDIGEECYLSLLIVPIDAFWAGIRVFRLLFARLPALQEAVVVVGCPVGG